MPLSATYGDGVTTQFRLPVHNQQATATVGGSAATIASQDPYSVTFTSAPALNAAVVISYTPVSIQAASRAAQLLAQSVIPFILTGTTAETTAYLVTAPAGSLRPGGRLRLYVFASSNVGRAGFWQYKIYYNNTLIYGQNNSTGLGSGSIDIDLFATSLSSQVAIPAVEGAANASVPVLLNADLTADTAFKITMTNASAADTTTVLGYSLEVINP